MTVLLLATVGCGKQAQTSNDTAAAVHDSGTLATKEDAPMPGTDTDEELVQRRYAQEFKVSPADVKVRVQKRVDVPGITVFSASVDPKKAGRPITRNGIVDGGEIYTEVEAMSRVAKAWGYGPSRPVAAKDFATVMATLHSATHGSSAITDADTLDVFKSTAHAKPAAAAELPKETTVDGHPAVQYSLTSEGPLTIVTAVVKPDFRVELQTQRILPD